MQQLLSWRVHFTLLPALSCYLCCDSEVCECPCIVNDFSGKFYILYLKPHTLYIVHCVQFYCIYECNVVSYTNGVLFIYISVYILTVCTHCVCSVNRGKVVSNYRGASTGNHLVIPLPREGRQGNRTIVIKYSRLSMIVFLRILGEGNRIIVNFVIKQIQLSIVYLGDGERGIEPQSSRYIFFQCY